MDLGHPDFRTAIGMPVTALAACLGHQEIVEAEGFTDVEFFSYILSMGPDRPG